MNMGNPYMRFGVLGIALSSILSAVAASPKSPTPEWTGKGKYRILVRVDPRNIGSRASDEMPTRIRITKADIQSRTGSIRKIDVASLQVSQYDAKTGQPVNYAKWDYAKTPWEIPYRWYDESIPEDFPEVLDHANTETGELQFVPERNWGYFFGTLGEWDGGSLAWIHTQRGNSPSYYAIYFDLLPAGSHPDTVPRTGFVGDGTERLVEDSPSTNGLLQGRVAVADWNGDGLNDLILGCERGGILWYPNRGTKERPVFAYSKLIFTADGNPLDVGFSSAPIILDWDGDRVQDLVTGVYPDRAAWYKNIGSNSSPKLEYKGLIHADGAPLHLPNTPVPEGEGVYPTDYFPTLEAADWDNDGDQDLLAGGYITGRIYLFENMARAKNGAPVLKSRGPIEADGKTLDTAWCAAPTVGDVDGDGDLDLVSGSMAMTAGGGDSSSSENFLYYFNNTGTRKEPRLMKQRFPVKGTFPDGSVAGPRLADLNNDGLLDLVVSRTSSVAIYFNVGSKASPQWEYGPPLTSKWGSSPLVGWASQLIDWNKDGHFDIVDGFNVRLNLKKENPRFFGAEQRFIGSENIFHKSPWGDQWSITHTGDLDSDGKTDILYGVHEGWVFFHRNLSSDNVLKFDVQGLRLNTEDGKPIKVGPLPSDKMDFDILQGARTTVDAGDLDRDGKVDIVVGDTYGKLRFYRNLTGGTAPTFSQPVMIADLTMRVVPSVADWNQDGWLDVLVGSNQPYVVLNTGKQGTPQFLQPQLFKQPHAGSRTGGILEQMPASPKWRLVESAHGTGLYLPYEGVTNAADWNGDGDLDLMVMASYGHLCWYERSFLDQGYAPAQILQVMEAAEK